MSPSAVKAKDLPQSVRTLHPGYQGDFEEDPRKCGILRNTSCRRYREQLRTARRYNLLEALMIASAVIMVVTVLLLHSIDGTTAGETGPMAAAPNDGQLDGIWRLWSSVSELLVGDIANFRNDAGGSSQANKVPAKSVRDFYCEQHLDTKKMFRSIAQQVLNQDQALARLESTLRGKGGFKSVALLGPPGVGKTLTAMALRQHFPWPENVHTYSWATYVADEVRKFHMVRHFVEQLSGCGQNLLIIDNLGTCDYGIVPIFNALIVEREGERNRGANQTVVVLYIFNLETEHYWEQFELLQQLPADTTIVSFRPFGREELMDCLEHELLIEQRVLGKRALSTILDETDVYATGCKHLRQLVLQYGMRAVD